MRRAVSASITTALALAVALPTPKAHAQTAGVYSLRLTVPLDPGGAWYVDDIWHRAWATETDQEPPLAEADARLIFRDAAGAMTHSRLLTRQWICNGHCYETDSAWADIPAQPDAVVAELYTIDATGAALELKTSRKRSPSLPDVQILSPRPGETLRDGTLIEWRAMDADGDNLRYRLLYRPSAGFLRGPPTYRFLPSG